MKTALSVLAVVLLLPPRSGAQELLSPQEIVRRIQESGSVSPVNREVRFDGCPQADERGRRVFEAISAADIPVSAVAQLPTRWGREYVECDFDPLEVWFERALDQILSSNRPGAVQSFIWRLPPETPPTSRMRQSLWAAAANGSYQGEVLDLIATEAVRTLDPAEGVSMVVDAFANRSVTASWIYGQAGYLVSEYPSLYLPALARVTASLSEERLQMVLTSLHSHLAAGRVSARAQGLDAVREGVRTRENLPAHLRSLDPPAN